jgi:flavin reductase (DIM6/NTAB) family NADH-FMN oxidoreductase RutF
MGGEIMKMASIDIAKLPFQEAYKILLGAVAPRPIAWVSTISASGITNLAPFSFFNGVCSNPPAILFCPSNPVDREVEDTLRNVRETRQFVVNMVNELNAEKANLTSATYPFGVSEFEAVGLTPLESVVVRPPRVAESPIQLECELIQIVPVGEPQPGSGNVVIGRLVYAHILEEAWNSRNHIDISKIKPVSRLAGNDYAPVREVFTLQRPS